MPQECDFFSEIFEFKIFSFDFFFLPEKLRLASPLDLTGGRIAPPDPHVYSYPPNISESATVKELDE